MDRITSNVFGELDPDELSPTAALSGPRGEELTVTLDALDRVHFTQDALDRVERQLDDLQTRDRHIRDFLLTDAHDGESATNLYLSHHLQELESETPIATFGFVDAQGIEPHVFIDLLRIRHISLQPAKNETTPVFDYGFDAEITSYILAVETNETGAVDSLAMES